MDVELLSWDKKTALVGWRPGYRAPEEEETPL
jgi:hypothetical protein